MSFRSLMSGFIYLMAVACICGVHEPVSAEFYQWIDKSGRKHVSNIPRRGVHADGTLKERYDPNSVAYQHAQLLSSLRREATEIERRQALTQAQTATPNTKVPARRVARRAAP